MRLALPLFAAATIASLPALAYRFETPTGGSTTNPAQAERWPASAIGASGIPWELAATATTRVGTGTTAAQVRQAAIDGFASWSQAAPAVRVAAPQSLATSSEVAQDDGHNRIFWVDSGWTYGSQTLGVTTPWAYSNGQIVDADIVFNSTNWKWQVGQGAYQTCAGCLDAKSITTHEEGHFLGMAHSCETNEISPSGPSSSCPAAQYDAVMVAYYDGVPKQELAQDDITGIRLLYPSAAAHTGPQGSICTSATDCQSGLECAGPEAGGTAICTKACTSSSTCGSGDSCQASTSGNACLPASAAGTGDLCKACGSGADCANGLCLSTDTFAYCTIPCSQTAGCPAGYACVAAQGSSQSFCYPTAQKCQNGCPATPCPSGQACESGSCVLQPAGDGQSCTTAPCQTGLVCVGASASDATCHETCTPGGANSCPTGETCDQLVDQNGQASGDGACFSGSDGGGTGQLGQACAATGCVNGLVCVGEAQDGSDAVCRQVCTPGASNGCPSGATCDALTDGTGACFPGTTPPTAGLCEACGNGTGCESGLLCAQSAAGKFCRKPCSSQSACAGSAACEPMGGLPGGATGLCGCGASEGGACTGDGECEAGLVCIDDQTQTPAACRKSCVADTDCPTGEACTVIGHAKVCEKASSSGGGTTGGSGGGLQPITGCGCANGNPALFALAMLGLFGLIRRRRA